MMDFFLQRLKAFAALAAPGVTLALIKAGEKLSGVPLPADWEAYIVMAVTGIVGGVAVHQLPNKEKVNTNWVDGPKA
jgi:hypothetical protein